MPIDAQRLQILQAERDWLDATKTGNTIVLARLMVDDYEQVNPDGQIATKTDVLMSFAPGDRHWDEAETDEIRVKLFGEVAVVTGLYRARGSNAGKSFDYSARYVAVWVLRDGRWQIVSDQSTELS